MQGDKEIRNKLAETEENVDMLHGAIQILVGGHIFMARYQVAISQYCWITNFSDTVPICFGRML